MPLAVQYSKTCSFWASAVVGNWASRFYKYIRIDVEAKQAELEGALVHEAGVAEDRALELLALGRAQEASLTLQDMANTAAAKALTTWNELFEVSEWASDLVADFWGGRRCGGKYRREANLGRVRR